MVRRRLETDAAVGLRQALRAAVTSFAAGETGLASVHNQIERIAKYLTHPYASLGEAKCCVVSLVACRAPHMVEETGLPGWSFPDLYESVKDVRDDLAHTGTEAALAGTRTVALACVLMEALMSPSKSTTVGQIMVPNPVCAHGWQTLADVRRTMLMHDYSTLPLKTDAGDDGKKWRILHAKELGEYLLEDRKRIKETLNDSKVRKRRAQTVCPNTRTQNVACNVPLLVTANGGEDGDLQGIITAFDLL